MHREQDSGDETTQPGPMPPDMDTDPEPEPEPPIE
jgi:hypothetical protein